MNKNLYETAERAMKESLDDYYDGVFDLNYVPEKVGEILEHELDCAGQRVYTEYFWLEDNDADLDTALGKTIDFCMQHKVKAYAIVLDDSQELVFVVYLVDEQ
jgi:hypothetical protein